VSAPSIEYSAYGLRICSEIPLPGLLKLAPEPGARADLSIMFGQVGEGPGPGHWYSLASNRSRLIWAGVGRFDIEGGHRIVVTGDGAEPRFLAHVILGPAMALLLQQRGLFPLHASVVEIDGAAVAIAGSSGAGKSTLAHALARRGCPLVADDIAALEVRDGVTWVLPGQAAHRLWPDTLRRAGVEPESAELLHEQTDKRLVGGEMDARSSAPRPLPISRVVLLRPGERVAVARIDGLERALAFVAQIYYPELLVGADGTKAVFDRCARIASTVATFELERPRERDTVEELADRFVDLSWA
jgi:hypothetical protein